MQLLNKQFINRLGITEMHNAEAWVSGSNFERVNTIYELLLVGIRSRDSVVGTATGYGLDSRGVGVRVQVVSRILSSPRR
jgi:hypothetical protein